MTATEEVTEGWGIIRPGDRKAHYYRDTMSLCRRVGFYRGSLDGNDKPSPDDCGACRKQRDRELAKGAATSRTIVTMLLVT
jgi:hypothetical protein